MSLDSQLLHGTRVRLTSLTSDDVPTVVRWHQDPFTLRLLDARPAMPRPRAELEAWLDEQGKSSDAFVFGIQRQGDDALIGYVEIDGILWAHGTAWLSYLVGETTERGKGYGTEALGLALQFAFNELNLHRIQATVFSYNQPSIRLLEALRFRREGVYREFLQRDGQRHDMLLYGLLRHEWEAAKG